MKRSEEFTKFDAAMDTLLRADPAAVKAEMDRHQQEHAKEREAKGERKRGRKPKSISASARASDATGD